MRTIFSIIFIFCTGLTSISTTAYSKDISFVAYDCVKKQYICQSGQNCHKRLSPCSTFKIALSLIGFDKGILIDENTPTWPYRDYEAILESHKGPQTPQSWMTNSVVWYSQLLTPLLSMPSLQHYVSLFDYGNQDLSGDPGKNNGLTHAWLSSSLSISPMEQVDFLKKLVEGSLAITPYAMQMTRNLLFIETTEGGWKLYGKTGTGHEVKEDRQQAVKKVIAWFVGWIEKDNAVYIFALNMKNLDAIPSKAERIALTKKLLAEVDIAAMPVK